MPGFGRTAKAAIIAAHGILGWAFCGAIIGVGRQVLSMETTLLVHAAGAPIGFTAIALFYFRKFALTSPLQTAFLFLSIVAGLDVFLVAPVFERSFAMFASVLGTWIPFALIFTATYLTGSLLARHEAGRTG